MHVRLELARDPEFVNGSHECGYEFVAPLDADGHLDAAEWKTQRERCRVRRFWSREHDEIGHLVHRRGGSWAFDYNPETSSDDEPGYRLSSHRFVPGEYVSFKEHDGKMRTFLIKAVTLLD
jgi:hypothetical protein